MDFNSRVAARLQAHDAQLEKTRALLTEATTALAEAAHDAATEAIHAPALVAARAGAPGALHATTFEGRPAWVKRHTTRDAVTVLLPADAAAFAHAGTTPQMDAASAANLSLELLSFNGARAAAFGTLASLAVLLEPSNTSASWLTRAGGGALVDPRLPGVKSTAVLGPAQVKGELHLAIHVDFERATRRVVLSRADRAGDGIGELGSTGIAPAAALCAAQTQPYRLMFADPQWQASFEEALAEAIRERAARKRHPEDGQTATSFHWCGVEFRPRFADGDGRDAESLWLDIRSDSPLNRTLNHGGYWDRTVYKPELLVAALNDDSVAFADRMAIVGSRGAIRVKGVETNHVDARVFRNVVAAAAANDLPVVVQLGEHTLKMHIPGLADGFRKKR